MAVRKTAVEEHETNVDFAYRLVILHVGGSNEFIPKQELIYRARSTMGGYHGQMNAAYFKKSFVKTFNLNLPFSQ
jgi:hypothetical protein